MACAKRKQQSSNSPAADAETPPWVHSDPIVQQLLKLGKRVNRANYLTLDRGSPSEEDLDQETLGALERMFPSEAPATNTMQSAEDAIEGWLHEKFPDAGAATSQEEPASGKSNTPPGNEKP
jgi:hypothetical protein